MSNVASSDALRQALVHALDCADTVGNTVVSAFLEHCLALLDQTSTR